MPECSISEKLLLANLTEGPFLCCFLDSMTSQHLLVPNLCSGIKKNLTSSCRTTLILEDEMIQLTLHNFCKNENIAPVKNVMKVAQSIKLCCYFSTTNSSIFKWFIGLVKFITRSCHVKK